MAVTSTRISASPEQVWAVLSDGWMYSNWVVGTSHVRAVERAWPSVGSRLFHATGIWPAVRRDETQVEQCEPYRRLVVVAKARPFGQARVDVQLDLDDGGTTVMMTETAISGPGKWWDNPAFELLLTRRNIEALARLSALAERRQRPQD